MLLSSFSVVGIMCLGLGLGFRFCSIIMMLWILGSLAFKDKTIDRKSTECTEYLVGLGGWDREGRA